MDFLQQLQDLGFTHVTFDMARGVSITAWRGSERKTYSVYFAVDLASAEGMLINQVLVPEPEPTSRAIAAPVGDFEDILG